MKRPYLFLWISFGILFLCKLFFKGDISTLAVFLWSALLSVFLLVKIRMPSKKGILISLTLTVLVVISGLCGRNNAFGTVLFGVGTLLSSMAVTSEAEKNESVKLLRSHDKKGLFLSLAIGAAAAVPLIVINTLAMSSSNAIAPVFEPVRVLWAVQPGIGEEMVMRAVFMAFCLHHTEKPSKAQSIAMYIMMSMPHALGHGMDIIGCLISGVIFGLPFSFLQRKRDITAAIFSHFLVDTARFIIFGC
ncbi:MAG: hypothetical protein J6F31_04885 [Oscillospiraceae bacterium]|nr:hypothetical protein [Oscillospiraceae bacterium]